MNKYIKIDGMTYKKDSIVGISNQGSYYWEDDEYIAVDLVVIINDCGKRVEHDIQFTASTFPQECDDAPGNLPCSNMSDEELNGVEFCNTCSKRKETIQVAKKLLNEKSNKVYDKIIELIGVDILEPYEHDFYFKIDKDGNILEHK